MIEDLTQGYFPNLPAERGWKVEWKHNPKPMLIKTVAAVAVGLLVYLSLKAKKKSLLDKLLK